MVIIFLNKYLLIAYNLQSILLELRKIQRNRKRRSENLTTEKGRYMNNQKEGNQDTNCGQEGKNQ